MHKLGTEAQVDTPKAPLWLSGILIAGVMLLFAPTVKSMAAIWSGSETFAHGYVIFPISAYLLWRVRASLWACTYRPDWLAGLILPGLGLGWLLAHAAGVQVLEQYFVVGMIPMIAWSVLGWQAFRCIGFPLLFLLFAVPFGEFLLLPLMHFTADFVVLALRITGIPVYREGLMISVPTGQWSVVEACSGLRYLIASVTLGTLYAYLTYRSLSRRLIFVLMSILVPILANGMRAYFIVMIGHWSDMRLAVGIDHFIYGWVWFGIVMVLLFWVGSYWREDEVNVVQPAASRVRKRHYPLTHFVLMAVWIAVALLPWPMYARIMDTERPAVTVVSLVPPAPVRGWQLHEPTLLNWRPQYHGVSGELLAFYQRADTGMGVYLAYYARQRQGAELTNSKNSLLPRNDPVWQYLSESRRPLMLEGEKSHIRETILRSESQHMMIWQWHEVDAQVVDNPYLEKLLLAMDKVLGRRDDGAAIVIFTHYAPDGDSNQVSREMEAFVRDMLPSIRARLHQAAGEAHVR